MSWRLPFLRRRRRERERDEAIAIAAALAVSRLLESLLFRVTPSDPASGVAAALLLAGGAVVASGVPAYRPTRLNPNDALRSE